jgi:two-component system, OmpR family, sensor histidine kinase KdpD
MPDENRARVEQNLRLAEELGAKVVNISDDSVAEVVITFAKEHNVTKIIAGKPLRSRWTDVLHPSVIDQIIRNSGRIDVYVVSEGADFPQKAQTFFWKPHRPFLRYLGSLVLVVILTLLGFPLRHHLDPTNLVMLYLVAVVFSAVFLGRGPSILASVVSVFAFDYFFVDPRFSFSVSDTQYLLTFAGLLVVGLIISSSASHLRDQVDILRKK